MCLSTGSASAWIINAARLKSVVKKKQGVTYNKACGGNILVDVARAFSCTMMQELGRQHQKVRICQKIDETSE